MLNSLASIARDTIARKNPFPSLPGFPSNEYACKWGLTDLYPEDEKILRGAIENRKTFDTGWVGCKKEIRDFRMISDGKVLTIQTSAAMDDFDELIYDALDDDTELTDDQIEELNDYWNESLDMSTETESEATIPVTTYESAMEVMSKMEDENDKQLEEWFEIVKSWVKEVTSR